MLKTAYKTRNARRRMDELRKIEADGARIAERHDRLINTQTLPINYPYRVDYHAQKPKPQCN